MTARSSHIGLCKVIRGEPTSPMQPARRGPTRAGDAAGREFEIHQGDELHETWVVGIGPRAARHFEASLAGASPLCSDMLSDRDTDGASCRRARRPVRAVPVGDVRAFPSPRVSLRIRLDAAPTGFPLTPPCRRSLSARPRGRAFRADASAWPGFFFRRARLRLTASLRVVGGGPTIARATVLTRARNSSARDLEFGDQVAGGCADVLPVVGVVFHAHQLGEVDVPIPGKVVPYARKSGERSL